MVRPHERSSTWTTTVIEMYLHSQRHLWFRSALVIGHNDKCRTPLAFRSILFGTVIHISLKLLSLGNVLALQLDCLRDAGQARAVWTAEYAGAICHRNNKQHAAHRGRVNASSGYQTSEAQVKTLKHVTRHETQADDRDLLHSF